MEQYKLVNIEFYEDVNCAGMQLEWEGPDDTCGLINVYRNYNKQIVIHGGNLPIKVVEYLIDQVEEYLWDNVKEIIVTNE